jgi:hypothetical protein
MITAGSRPARPAERGEERAWGWVTHLREGGTTPWRQWDGLDDSQGRYLPGAQQLELLRRLNVAGRPGVDLVQSVLAASAAGRGRPDLELVGAGPESAFGPAPVDPSGLPAGELVRVAASVLADQVVDLVANTGSPQARGPSRASWWRRGYRLVGDPELADPLRAQLIGRGRPPGGREPRIVVLGTDLATMAAHAWTHRAFTEGVAAWREWLRLLQERREIPAGADLLAVARAWERRVGKERVHVVLDPAVVPRLVGDRRGLAVPRSLPAEGGELARRVGSVLGLLVLPDVRERLLTTRLRPRVEAAAGQNLDGPPFGVPPAHRDWLEAAAERMRRGIRRAGYAVHGDLDALVPRWPDAPAGPVGPDGRDGPGGPSPGATLDLAVRVLLDDSADDRVDDGRTA